MTDGVGVCAPAGFKAAGVAAGTKPDGARDTAVVISDEPATAAGVFTTNLVKAAPVLVSQEHLAQPTARGVVMSSGNANAATGLQGKAVAEAMCSGAASVIGCPTMDVLIAQTGLIGFSLDQLRCVEGVERAAKAATPEGGMAFAEAILTTDTVSKTATSTIDLDGRRITVGGAAKGAAMLAPSMATMLAVLTTDASVAAEPLQVALEDALEGSFHSIVIDGQSTNDTVFLLANGASKAPELELVSDPSFGPFAAAVGEVAHDLALAMVRDAEGATKFLAVRVTGAVTDADAHTAAHAVARSPLVKCSLAGEDPYRGRVLSELGAAGVFFDPRKVSIAYGDNIVCAGGEAAPHDPNAAAAYMRRHDLEIRADLGAGEGTAIVYGSDLTHAYLDENMGTS